MAEKGFGPGKSFWILESLAYRNENNRPTC